MKKFFTIFLTCAVLGASCSELTHENDDLLQEQTLSAKLTGDTEGEHETGMLLVKLTEEAVADIESGALDPMKMFQSTEISAIGRVIRSTPDNEKVMRRHGLHLWYEIRFDENIPAGQIAASIASDSRVRAIQYNSLIEPVRSSVSGEISPAIPTRSATGTTMPFDDPQLGVQWNLINTGDKSISATAVEGADVGVKDAWRLTGGDPRVIVAVLDQGVYFRHRDLAEAMWKNEAEINGTPGVDDDNNNYVDDKYGYNFYEQKGTLSYKYYTGDHGTHIAGTIAATNNNGMGVSSIAGGTGNGDGVRIMSCQIYKESYKASDSKVAQAFIYAADNGACIASCSYGSMGGAILKDTDYTADAPLEYSAIQYFLDKEKCNCKEALESNIVVFAAGNNNGPASSYPGALPECISVTAICPDFMPGGYSNYGPGCDIAAPGGDIVSGRNDAPCMILSTGISSSGSEAYTYKFGTSMACPHVSGVVALGISYALKIGKTFSREEFISKLLTSTNDIDSHISQGTTKLYYNGNAYENVDISVKRNKMGTGAVDAWRFLMALEGTPTIVVKAGEKTSIRLSDYIGDTAGSLEYTLSIDSGSMSSLGLESVPEVTDGMIGITCNEIGAGKMVVSSSIGKDDNMEDGISGLTFSREISIVSRSNAAKNGGWL